MTQPDHPAISVSISHPDAKLAETRDGALLTVKVKNELPCVREGLSTPKSLQDANYLPQDIPIDEVAVVFQGREGDRLTFSAKVGTLSPGTSTLTLFCPVSDFSDFLVFLNYS